MGITQQQRLEAVYQQYYRELFAPVSAAVPPDFSLIDETFNHLDPLQNSLTDFFLYFAKNWSHEIENLSSATLVVGSALGGLCQFLAEKKRKVLGLDCSAAAVAMAAWRARDCEIRPVYIKGDILSPSPLLPPTDQGLIIDNHCYHGILWSDQRKKYHQHLQKLLHPSGYFLLETICLTSKANWPAPYFLDSEDNLWYEEAPYRKLAPAQKIEQECLAAGWSIEYFVFSPQLRYQCTPAAYASAEHPPVGMLRMVLKKKN